MGKERGYLLYDEVNDLLPAEVHSSEEIDDLLSTFERYGIDIYEDAATAKAARAAADLGDAEAEPKEDARAGEDSDLDLTPGALEKTNDPVRMYLREMGTVPLLTREGEVTIAKRIERGQLQVLKIISRSPIILKEILAIGADLRAGNRSIKEIVVFDDEELTEEKIENKTRQTLKIIDKIERLYEGANQQAAKLERTPRSKKRVYLRARMTLGRSRVEMSQLLRSIKFTPPEKSASSTRSATPSSVSRPSNAKPSASGAVPTSLAAKSPPKPAKNFVRAAPSSAISRPPAKSASPSSSALSRSSCAARPKPNRPRRS